MPASVTVIDDDGQRGIAPAVTGYSGGRSMRATVGADGCRGGFVRVPGLCAHDPSRTIDPVSSTGAFSQTSLRVV